MIESFLEGKCAVVVDDNEVARKEIVDNFRSFGLEIIGEFDCARSFLQHFEELSPDIVSIDIIMDDMHGVECYHDLRKMSENVKVIFISYLCREAGLVDILSTRSSTTSFVSKPIDLQKLREGLALLYSENSSLPRE